MTGSLSDIGVWFPTIRTGTGTDQFTERLARGLDMAGIRALVTWLPSNMEFLPHLIKLPKAPEWATVAHVNSWLPQRVVPAGLPTVTTFHFCVHDRIAEAYKTTAQSLYHELIIKPREQGWCARSELTAVSRYTAEKVREVFGCEKPTVIHNWVDTNVFYPSEKEEKTNEFKILFAGNPIARKGCDFLPKIMSRLGANYTLNITVDKSSMPSSLRHNDRIKAIGRAATDQEMRAVYGQHDVLLFPSRLEGFGLVALESLACGVPVVGSNSSSLPEVVLDGECGYLCKVDDIDGYVDSITKLSENPVLYSEMVSKAVARAANFDSEKALQNYIDAYRKVLAESE